jgi:hypothetical protein
MFISDRKYSEAEQMLELRISVYRVSKSPIVRPKQMGQMVVTFNNLLDGDIHGGWYDLFLPYDKEKGEEKVHAGQLQLQLQYTSETVRLDFFFFCTILKKFCSEFSLKISRVYRRICDVKLMCVGTK